MTSQIQCAGKKQASLLKATLLISGTAVGGGMLALPIVSGEAGFFPTCLLFIVTWFVMSSTGVLIYENSVGLKSDSNLISLAGHAFGRWGKGVTWVLYLFLFYSLMTAYLAGLASFLEPFLPSPFHYVSTLVASLFFAPFLVLGVRFSSTVNLFMMFALFASFALFLALGLPLIEPSLLLRMNGPVVLWGLPIIFTSFSFQGTVPTIIHYLDQDEKRIKRAIWVGTAIPLILYILFEMLVLGLVPLHGPHGLQEALMAQDNSFQPLQYWIKNPFISSLGIVFSFFALFTSFIGVGLGLFDFLADGLRIEKQNLGKLLLALLVLTPPLIITAYNPRLFLTALDYAGGVGCALLLGVMPVLVALKRRSEGVKPIIFGGNIFLYVLLAFFFFEIVHECLSKI